MNLRIVCSSGCPDRGRFGLSGSPHGLRRDYARGVWWRDGKGFSRGFGARVSWSTVRRDGLGLNASRDLSGSSSVRDSRCRRVSSGDCLRGYRGAGFGPDPGKAVSYQNRHRGGFLLPRFQTGRGAGVVSRDLSVVPVIGSARKTGSARLPGLAQAFQQAVNAVGNGFGSVRPDQSRRVTFQGDFEQAEPARTHAHQGDLEQRLD